MANGEWRMANGEWRMANGEWWMVVGECLASGHRPLVSRGLETWVSFDIRYSTFAPGVWLIAES